MFISARNVRKLRGTMKFFKEYPRRAGLRFLFASIVGGIGATYGTFCGSNYFYYIINSYINRKIWFNESIMEYISSLFLIIIVMFDENFFSMIIMTTGIISVSLFGVSIKIHLDRRKKYNIWLFIRISIALAIIINVFALLIIPNIGNFSNFKFPSADRDLLMMLFLSVFTGIFSGGIGGWLFALLAPKPSEKAEAAAIPVSQPGNEP
jgi:hypothetical protein